MRVVFFGTPHFVVPVLNRIKTEFDLVGVMTTPDEKVGRKQLMTPTPVKQAITNRTIPVFTPETLTDTIAEDLGNLHPDIFVVAAYGKIIPKSILEIPKYGSINIHPSLLPKYRGPSPIQSTILHGDTRTGVTIILMDEEVDHGPILALQETTLSGNETFASLADQLFTLSADMVPDIINKMITNEHTPQEQDHEKAVFCEHISKEDGFFDSSTPPSPQKLDRMIRAYYPWPTVWTRLNVRGTEKIIKFLPEKKIQIEGKNSVGVKEFVNGYPELRVTLAQLLGEPA